MELILSISPCPNDTFIFDAILNNRIENGNYKFAPLIADVEELNKSAKDGYPHITKISFFAYFQVADKYQLLNAGSALGKNCGPLIVGKRKIYPDEIPYCKLAIPGKNTTAFLLLNILYKEYFRLKSGFFREYNFADIEEAVLSNECDAGLIIHESRFTYKNKGLSLISDLGELWENKFGLPLPLGGIAVKRDLNVTVKKDIDKLIGRSVKYALENPHESYQFIKKHSVIKDDDVVSAHIELYVNNFTQAIGDEGKKAVFKLYEESQKAGFVDEIRNDIFI